MTKILIIEDDIAMNRGIALTVEQDGMAALQAYDIASARQLFRSGHPDLLILDINLPDGSGLEFCREIRMTSDVPVLFLTANDLETDIVTGFEMGADDYITKPFSLMILRARVKAALRKRTGAESKTYQFGELRLDFEKMSFFKGEQPVQLSRTEQRMLHKFVHNQGFILSRDQLLNSVWENESEFVDENALTVTIKRLRGKIEDNPSEPVYIKTVYGLGYIWTGGGES